MLTPASWSSATWSAYLAVAAIGMWGKVGFDTAGGFEVGVMVVHGEHGELHARFKAEAFPESWSRASPSDRVAACLGVGAGRRGRGDAARRFRYRGHADLSVFATLTWLVVIARRVRCSGWWDDHDRNGGGTGE